MTVLSRCQKYLTAGISACGGALLMYYGINLKKNDERWIAHASWTTNYTPSCQWDYNWDRREPASLVKPSKRPEDDNRYNEELEKLKPTASRHIILIRHGQYNLNGKTDKERTLTNLGQEQAKLTGQRLKDLGYEFSQIIVSTMTRANETAGFIQKILPSELPVTHCSLLVEGAPIPPEPPVGHWKPEAYQFFQDGPRIEAAFRKYFHRADVTQKADSYDLVVCHANVIRYFVCRALQFPCEAWLRLSLYHASITWLTIMPSGRVKLVTYSDSGHMPLHAISS
uniref:Serine/threonine-protein phosphatase PGAM5, mitochondrial n=1 Tax=Clastoptera arizonana TaxID=38151 RepID=A0A1B6EGW0_9HEMI